MMETAFDLLDEADRSNHLRLLMQSFHCTYVCFWSFLPAPTNCLRGQDGMYLEECNRQMASSSSESFAQRLFYQYKQSIFILHNHNDYIPGSAFRNTIPYLEVQELQLSKLASNEVQRQFYQEGRIKVAIFIGCKNGEIELGFSNVPTDRMKMDIQSLFLREEHYQKITSSTSQSSQVAIHDHTLQNPHNNYSSSSSSLRSLANIDSPESLLFNINNNNATSTSTSTNINNNFDIISPSQEAVKALARLQNPKFPSPTAEEEVMTKAILAVLSNTSNLPLPGDIPPMSCNLKSSAFNRYISSTSVDRSLGCNKSMFKRSIEFFWDFSRMRNHQSLGIPQPSGTSQLHHMMSERKRREKLNESFHALRSLLPPGTKKDKATLLNTTKEYLTSLKAQIEELSQRNKQLEAQISPSVMKANREECDNNHGNESNQLLSKSHLHSDHQRAIIDVCLSKVSELESNDRDRHQPEIVNLQVILRSSNILLDDLVLGLLEFLKQVEDVSLVSLEANTNNLNVSTAPINRLTLRLIRVIEGSEWDKLAFEEAVRRVVANLAQ